MRLTALAVLFGLTLGVAQAEASDAASEVESSLVVEEGDEINMDKPLHDDIADEVEEERHMEQQLNALARDAPHLSHVARSARDRDATSHVHSVPIEEEEAMSGGYIFDIDNTNRDPQQRCYVRNQGADKTKMPDNIENSIVEAQEQLNDDSTNRAQWAKCLPPPMYTLLTVESFGEGDIYNGRFEKRMRNATDFYATLKWLHNEACAHIRIRLEPVFLDGIRAEVNWREKLGIGYKIKTALNPIILKIVDQYRSMNAKINPANAKTNSLLSAAIGPLKQALRVAKHSGLFTLENGEGRRRNNAAPSAREMLLPLYDNIMNFEMSELEKFMETRPGPLDDMMTGKGKRGLGEPEVGSDGLPDALKNYGRCGKPLFDYSGYTLYTMTISQDENGGLTFLTRKGWLSPEAVVAEAELKPLRMVLPPDAYEVETKTTSYQDDMFAQGNLACGVRADGAWTLTSYDRNSNENKVTATQDEGYFCIWMLNDLLVLPENQRAGFSNTEFIAESPNEMARVMNGDANNYKKYFPKPGEKYKYYHCHYSPRNSGAARVHSFQHQAERHYPGGIRQYCNCDWRRMGMIISRCDCTLDAKANGGCRRVEMEMLNEHSQFDLWRKDGVKNAPSRVALQHSDLAEGKVTSYTYENNRRRRQADNKNIYQEDTGRVRPTTDGNGGNNVVCSVNEAGVPDRYSGTYKRGGNIVAQSTVDPTSDLGCKPQPGLHEEVFYFAQGTSLSNLAGRQFTSKKTVTSVNYLASTSNWPGLAAAEDFAMRWWGDLSIKQASYYYFFLDSDDGSTMYLDGTLRVNNNHYNRRSYQNPRLYLTAKVWQLRVEYFQKIGGKLMRFEIRNSRNTMLDMASVTTASCTKQGSTTQPLERSFFTDMNNNGIMDYPACSDAGAPNQAHRRRGKKECTNNGMEFPLRDITSPNRISSPAGGANHEWVDTDGSACDPLHLKKTCKFADAGNLYHGSLANELAKFCDVSSALYQVPLHANGTVPTDFGDVTYPMPIHGFGGKWTNYRANAKAEFGAMGAGTTLFCKAGEKCPGNPAMAVQGIFYGIKDETVWSTNETDNVLKARFYPTVGGSKAGAIPSAVPTKWTQAGSLASGVFNNDVMTRYRRSTNEGTLYAKSRVESDSRRGEGVTCLNGKYVYARKMKDGSRPIVSTVREAFNRNGPLADGQWACRYMGVHCNANNCNNNGQTEVAGPFVEPKIRVKAEAPSTMPPPTDPPPTPAPTPSPTTTAPPGGSPTTAPKPTRRRSGKGGRRRRRRSSKKNAGNGILRRRRRRSAA